MCDEKIKVMKLIKMEAKGWENAVKELKNKAE